jgi:FtsZ-interacting cell division protein ZipA
MPLIVHRLPLAALLLMGLWASHAHAQWKWRDKDGHVTISDRPPPREVADTDILGRPPAVLRRAALQGSTAAASAASATAPSASAPLDRELEVRRKAAEAEAAAKAKADEERQAVRRADNCKRARAQMVTLDSGQRMSRINDKGEREVLDDSARAEEARRAREVIASECR